MSTSSAALDPREMAEHLYVLNHLLIKALVQCELACERDANLLARMRDVEFRNQPNPTIEVKT